MSRFFLKIWIYFALGVFLELFALFSLATGQFFNVLYRKNGTATDDRFGFSVAIIGDVDGDTKADFVIGASGADSSGKPGCGSVSVYSGVSGNLIYRRFGAVASAFLGSSVAGVGKIDADNYPDFISGAPQDDSIGKADCGAVYVFSGTNGNLIYKRFGAAGGDQLGYSVAGLGPVNADTIPDFICGAPYAGANDAGSVTLYSGATGNPFQAINGTSDGDRFGWAVGSLGDVVNNDGKSEFVVAAPYADVFNPDFYTDAGIIYAYSGTSQIWQVKGITSSEYLGVSVSATAMDIANAFFGDTLPEVIVGGTYTCNMPGGNAGTADVIQVLGFRFTSKFGVSNGDAFGASVANIGDLNGDGKAEFVVGAPCANPAGLSDAGSAYVYNSLGGILFQAKGVSAGDRFGEDVEGGGDIDGDSKPDFIIGATQPVNGTGYAKVYVSCTYAKGDMNGVDGVAPADIVLLLYCVFLGTGNCNRCFADVDCDGVLGPSDVTLILNKVYVGTPLPCE